MIVQALQDQGVDTVFGYPGGGAAIYDAIFNQNYVKHVLVRHEQDAADAAEGDHRAFHGKVGGAADSGPLARPMRSRTLSMPADGFRSLWCA